jgi:L,D-transpeptidase catalytic domain
VQTKVLVFIAFLAYIFFSCESKVEDNSKNEHDRAIQDSIQKVNAQNKVNADTLGLPEEPEPNFNSYRLLSVKDTLDWLMSLPKEQLENILRINRLNKSYLARQDSIVVPDSLVADKNVYCPFPMRINGIREVNKIIFVSRFSQAFVAYENGQRVNWGPVSTGKSSKQTPNGFYSTNWKSKRNISSINSSWILNWYFNISNSEGIAFHEYVLPGVAASHGCIRMYEEDSKWMYDWAYQWIVNDSLEVLANGTPVIVFDQYPYNERRPWWYLPENNLYLTKTPEQMMEVFSTYQEKIMERQKIYFIEKKKKEERLLQKADSLKVVN